MTFILFASGLWCLRRKNVALQYELNQIKDASTDGIIEHGKFSELGLMSAGIAHEISNPLTVIQARVHLMQKTYRDPAKQKDLARGLQQINKASQRIENIIAGVRQYIYRNDDQSEDQIALSEIIDDVLLFCGQRLKNHGIEFRTKGIEAIFLRGHKGQFEQVLMHLINNSFDAIDKLEEKWIEVSAVEGKEVVDIYFKDSGPGITVDVRKKMMEPFFTSNPQGGSGIGLPMVKTIAERHGGTFQYVDRAPNTTFLLELPRATKI